ncbi:putative F-box protein At1g65770 [Lycium ferocissimum]|uniref:putative F-box protein At1g65770 n=1 Tax=Lycium ferocissimum TaxID=112874 RepID=UPI002815CA36|nr:putative F-box protein At1g65770 [Lycium ferocissimum]
MVIEANNKYLSYWRPGHLRWTRIKEEASLLRDVVYFNGKFYAIRWLGDMLVCDFTGGDPTEAQKVAQLPRHQVGDEQYIVESLGSLFVVARHGCLVKSRIPLTPDDEVCDDEVDEKLTFETRYFRVYKVDLAAGKLTETKELGDRAIFLGANASLSVQASQFPGVKPNHIYFTDDNYVMYCSYLEGGSLDMGVFNIADDTIVPHYEGVSLSRYTPPTWVTPTLY